MRALIAEAEWMPRPNYALTDKEKTYRMALVGSQVWRNPSFEIRNAPTPDIKEDEVLIRVKICGVCGSDTHLYETGKDGYIIFSGLTRLPCILGHEFSGVVGKTGGRVTGLKTGDRVAVESVMWCGTCSSCRSGDPNQCKNVNLLGLSRDGAFAEYVAVNERYCWKINDLMEVYAEDEAFALGALIEPVGCAYNGIFIAGGGFKPGGVVVVYGVGPIGLGAVALAGIAGASRIIAFDVIDERVEIARKMGADYAFNIKKMGTGSGDKVMELTQGEGADILVEAAGAAPQTIPEMEKALSSQGKIIYLGRAATKTSMYLDTLVSGANKIIGARGHSGYGIFPKIIKLIASRKLDLSKMVTLKYPFAKGIEALRKSVDRKDGKILVNLSSG
ncbi:MAG: alcohol dehydrogenase catalytic domain-containing protein [Candidatus Schekmanbacteria bacterium]|nr:alcohol dehydrogenase catalytic domain-containing protein [Candidatus Schekmanbacteria bacterium]